MKKKLLYDFDPEETPKEVEENNSINEKIETAASKEDLNEVIPSSDPFTSHLEAIVRESSRGNTVEDRYTRQTFLLENSLNKRFNALAKKHTKGFKTKVINAALAKALDELEGLK